VNRRPTAVGPRTNRRANGSFTSATRSTGPGVADGRPACRWLAREKCRRGAVHIPLGEIPSLEQRQPDNGTVLRVHVHDLDALVSQVEPLAVDGDLASLPVAGQERRGPQCRRGHPWDSSHALDQRARQLEPLRDAVPFGLDCERQGTRF
jgi:hypothetical protein